MDCKWEPIGHWSACSATCGLGTRRRKLKGIPPKHGGLPCTTTKDDQRQLFGLTPSHANGGHDHVRLDWKTCNIKKCTGESFSYCNVDWAMIWQAMANGVIGVPGPPAHSLAAPPGLGRGPGRETAFIMIGSIFDTVLVKWIKWDIWESEVVQWPS